MQRYKPWTNRGKRVFPRDFANTLNEKWRKGALAVMAGIPEPMLDCPPAPPEVRDAAVSEFLSTLRGLADQWLASGRTQLKRFGERPWSRSVNWFSDDYPKPIAETLLDFRDRNPPRVVLNGNGRFSIATMGPLNHSSWATMLSQSINLQQHAKDNAIAQFVLLLDSSCPQRLFRCDYKVCGEFFVLARNPREQIAHGTYCSKCKKHASARRMASTSKKRHNDLVGFAADVLEEYETKFGELSKWIAEMVNLRTLNIKAKAGKESEGESHYPVITGRWATTHIEEIGAAVAKRKSVTA